ncbi:hypothetical protein [Crossiella sp. CA198]|uniref:hypothetical protein n=1 Tax=Crossiella sp. CA198 TaxID=3455607 RepID=UPI003F8D7851
MNARPRQDALQRLEQLPPPPSPDDPPAVRIAWLEEAATAMDGYADAYGDSGFGSAADHRAHARQARQEAAALRAGQ